MNIKEQLKKYKYKVEWSEEYTGWVATVDAFKGISFLGVSAVTAIAKMENELLNIEIMKFETINSIHKEIKRLENKSN